MTFGRAGEYSIDIGGVLVDIGHHHHNVARFKRWVVVEPEQELVMQALNFPQRAVPRDYPQTLIVLRY